MASQNIVRQGSFLVEMTGRLFRYTERVELVTTFGELTTVDLTVEDVMIAVENSPIIDLTSGDDQINLSAAETGSSSENFSPVIDLTIDDGEEDGLSGDSTSDAGPIPSPPAPPEWVDIFEYLGDNNWPRRMST